MPRARRPPSRTERKGVDMKIDGSCHCGRIRYEAEVDPAKVVICHCTDCQTLSGSAFRTVVPRSVRLAEAPSFGKPILLYDIRSRGAQAYLDLAKEIMAHEKKGAGQGALRAPAGS